MSRQKGSLDEPRHVKHGHVIGEPLEVQLGDGLCLDLVPYEGMRGVPALVLAAVSVASRREYLEGVVPNILFDDFLLPLISIGFLTMIAVSCHRMVIEGVVSLPNATRG